MTPSNTRFSLDETKKFLQGGWQYKCSEFESAKERKALLILEEAENIPEVARCLALLLAQKNCGARRNLPHQKTRKCVRPPFESLKRRPFW